MADTATPTVSVAQMHDAYLALVKRRRLYSGLMLLIFVVLMVTGFNTAAARNGGSFWGGIGQFFDYPSEVVSEALSKADQLPGHLVTFFPALVETINIAAVSTLIGTFAGIVFSLLGTRGLARYPRLIPLFRRTTDILRAIPEIVIALVLIFILGGGPVPAMIAIAIHTAGAMGKLFSEVNEKRRSQAHRGAALGRGQLVAADDAGRGAAGRAQLAELCAAALRGEHPRQRDPGLCGRGRPGLRAAQRDQLGPGPL
jgi:phosphonate transport system permease protein